MPGSLTATITTTGTSGRGKTFAVPLPVLTAPALLRDTAHGVLVTRTITYILRCAQVRPYTPAGLRVAQSVQSVDTCAWD